MFFSLTLCTARCIQIQSSAIAKSIVGFKDKVVEAQLGLALSFDSLSYHLPVLLSCEKRSALTDYAWIRKIGQGAFGRSHLCRNRFSKELRAIKFIMPEGDEHGAAFARDVKECEMHQRLNLSEFVTNIYAWGSIDGELTCVSSRRWENLQ